MPVVGRLDQYGSMLAGEFDETTANNPSITGLGTYYATEFNENIVDIVRDELVLNLDAGNLASYSGSGTTWNDLSGYGNNGTLTNGPTYSSANGGSIVFDGVNDKATTNITSFGNNTTWEAWVNRTTNANAYNMFMGRTLPYFGLRTSNIIFSNIIGGSQQTLNSTGFTPSNNTWYYLAFTTEYDGANTIPKIYINGVLNNSTTFTGAQGGSTDSFTIGEGRSTTAWYPFDGKVSNVKIYNRTLTATEVLQNYNALATRFGLATTNSTAPMLANVFAPYDPVYDEFGGTLFGAGQGRYMRQNTDKSVIVYNEIDEVTDFRDIVRSGLVLDLDAGMNASFNNTGTIWNDLSGNGNNGTLTNGPTYSSANGGSLAFNGTNYISSFPTQISTTDSRTVSCFFRTNVTTRNGLCGTRGNAVATGWVLTVNQPLSGSLNYFHTAGSGIDVAAGISINTWYNACVTYDVATATATLYLNGAQIGSPVTSFSAMTPSVFNGAIGAEDGQFNNKFNGNIAQVQVYNRALTAAEIQQNYNALKHRYGL